MSVTLDLASHCVFLAILFLLPRPEDWFFLYFSFLLLFLIKLPSFTSFRKLFCLLAIVHVHSKANNLGLASTSLHWGLSLSLSLALCTAEALFFNKLSKIVKVEMKKKVNTPVVVSSRLWQDLDKLTFLFKYLVKLKPNKICMSSHLAWFFSIQGHYFCSFRYTKSKFNNDQRKSCIIFCARIIQAFTPLIKCD